MAIQRDEKAIKKELEALDRLINYPEYKVFIEVISRFRVNCIEEIMREGIDEKKEDFILGKNSIFKGLMNLPEDIKNCSNENIRGKSSALRTVVLYLKDIPERIFQLLKSKEEKTIKEEIINDNSLQS